jgi:predicted ribosomally synthesized peptide with nif11-like leader
MAKENVNAFIDVVYADPLLQERLNAASHPAEVLAIAKEVGFDLHQEDFMAYRLSVTADLSDEELGLAAGGFQFDTFDDELNDRKKWVTYAPDGARCFSETPPWMTKVWSSS